MKEGVQLQVSQIDSVRMVLPIRNSKGHKDRLVPLPEPTLAWLRAYWADHRHPAWLFPSGRGWDRDPNSRPMTLTFPRFREGWPLHYLPLRLADVELALRQGSFERVIEVTEGLLADLRQMGVRIYAPNALYLQSQALLSLY